MNEQVPAEKKLPSPELLRAWAASADNQMCWGLDAVADELVELRASLSREETVRNILTSDNTRLRELSRTEACPPGMTPPRELLYEGHIYIREDRS